MQRGCRVSRKGCETRRYRVENESNGNSQNSGWRVCGEAARRADVVINRQDCLFHQSLRRNVLGAEERGCQNYQPRRGLALPASGQAGGVRMAGRDGLGGGPPAGAERARWVLLLRKAVASHPFRRQGKPHCHKSAL